jgi:hypothetical protein
MASHGSDLRPSTFFFRVKIILIRPTHGNRTEWLIIEMLSGSIPLLKPCYGDEATAEFSHNQWVLSYPICGCWMAWYIGARLNPEMTTTKMLHFA